MFWTRLASGVILVIIALVTMSLGGWALAGILLAISLIAYRELLRALSVRKDTEKTNGLEVVGMIGIILYYVASVLSD